MLEEVCAGARVAMFIILGMVNMKQYVPFSVESQYGVRPVTDSTRYQRGDIWWFENRDDISQMSAKIRACELNSINATSFGRRLGCYIQRSKLRVRRQLTHMVKNVAQFAVEQTFAHIEALSGPNALLALFKLLLSTASTALGIGKLIYHRHYLMELIRNYIEDWVNQYAPTAVQLPSMRRRSRTMYISDKARDPRSRRRRIIAARDATVPDDNDDDYEDNDDLAPAPPSPHGSPRSSVSALGAHGGSLEEPIETPVLVRGSPRRQQQHRDALADDDTVDRIAAFDTATARAMGLFGAAGAGSDNDLAFADYTHSEAAAAEPLTKKRVAFKDDPIDDAEMGWRRSPPSSPVGRRPSSDNQTPTPAAETISTLRGNRFGPRGRAGGVSYASRRPLLR